MRNPISATYRAFDRALERLCDRAFEADVAEWRAQRPKPVLTEREKLLVAVSEGRIDELSDEELQDATDGFLIERDDTGISLTSVGRYLLPTAATLAAAEYPTSSERQEGATQKQSLPRLQA